MHEPVDLLMGQALQLGLVDLRQQHVVKRAEAVEQRKVSEPVHIESVAAVLRHAINGLSVSRARHSRR